MFAGCGTVGYTYSVYNDGSIQESFDVDLDATALATAGIDVADTITKIDDIVAEWWTSYATNPLLIDKVKLEADTTQPTVRKYTIQFASSEAYRIFYNIPPTTDSDIEDKIIHSAFCDRLVMCDRDIDLSNFAPLSIYTQLVTYIADKYYAGEHSLALAQLGNIDANIIYLYPANYMVHSNADYVERNGIYSAHIWVTDLGTLTTPNAQTAKHMYIYRNYYSADNIANWYILGIGLTLAFGIILATVLIIKHRNNLHSTTNTTTNITPTTNVDNIPTDTPTLTDTNNDW